MKKKKRVKKQKRKKEKEMRSFTPLTREVFFCFVAFCSFSDLLEKKRERGKKQKTKKGALWVRKRDERSEVEEAPAGTGRGGSREGKG